MPRKAKRTQAPRAPQDQAYGASGEQVAAQRAVPIPDARAAGAAAGPAPVAPAAPNLNQPANPQVPSADPRAAVMQAAAGVPRGGGLLAGPSRRSNEPVTAGLPVGAGVGPEGMPRIMRGPNPDIGLWRDWLPMLELMASQPGSSSEVRQFYRRLRAQTPPDPYRQPVPG